MGIERHSPQDEVWISVDTMGSCGPGWASSASSARRARRDTCRSPFHSLLLIPFGTTPPCVSLPTLLHHADTQVGGDVLMGVLQRCGLAAAAAAAGGSGIQLAGGGAAAVDGALSVVLGGQWPSSSRRQQQQQQPRGFEEVFEALGRSPEAAVSVASRDPLRQVSVCAGGGLAEGGDHPELILSSPSLFFAIQTPFPTPLLTSLPDPLNPSSDPLSSDPFATPPPPQVQQLLVMDRLSGLAGHLYRWLVAREAAPEAVHFDNEEDGGIAAAIGEEGSGGVGFGLSGLPPRHQRMVAFAAHLLLLLEGLGASSAAEDAVAEREQARCVWGGACCCFRTRGERPTAS